MARIFAKEYGWDELLHLVNVFATLVRPLYKWRWRWRWWWWWWSPSSSWWLMVGEWQCPLPHRNCYTKKIYAENTASQSKLLHSENFIQRNSYTQTLLYTETFTKRNHCAEQFPHAEIVTQRKHCTEQFSHTGVFTERNLYTEQFLHTNDFTQNGFYTRRFNTQKTLQEHLLHKELFALRTFCT